MPECIVYRMTGADSDGRFFHADCGRSLLVRADCRRQRPKRCLRHGRNAENRHEPGRFSGQDNGFEHPAANYPGGVDKLKEAEVVLIGGHSIEDKEIKYGLSVTGVIHPEQVLAKKNLRPGDNLVLTKPLGTGIVNTAIKADMVSEQLSQKVTRLMAALNRDAAKIMADFDISACTDVTGFGLLGHLAEMVNGSGCSARIFSGQVPVIPEAEDFAAMGLIPAGAYKNREFREQMITFAETVPAHCRICCSIPRHPVDS
jgi:selenide,water dikinase